MVGVLAVGFLANLAMTRVPGKYHEPELDQPDPEAAAPTASSGQQRITSHPALLVFACSLVGIPLVYGVYQIAVKTASLFG